MKPIAATLPVLLLSLTATACGGGDETPDDEGPLTGADRTAAASITQFWLEAGVEKSGAQCLGEEMVRSFGVAHLQDLDLLDERYQANDSATTVFRSATDAPKAAALIVDCRGLPTLMKQQYQGIDDETAQCLADAYGRDRMVEAMAASLRDEEGEATPEDVTLEMSKCVQTP